MEPMYSGNVLSGAERRGITKRLGLDVFFFQSRVQTKIAERSRAGTKLIASCITKGFAKCGGVDTGVSREYRVEIDREGGVFLSEYVQAQF